jgi:hypothetical protein
VTPRSSTISLLLAILLTTGVAQSREADGDGDEQAEAAAGEEEAEVAGSEEEEEGSSDDGSSDEQADAAAGQGDVAAGVSAAAGTGAEAEAKPAGGEAGAAGEEPFVPSVDLAGYLSPGFGLRYRPEALPVDQLEHGFFGTAGLIVKAAPVEMWTGTVHLLFSTSVLRAVTGVSVFDYGGDGEIDGVAYTWQEVPGVVMEEATVAFDPIQYIGVKAGAMRIPFTLQQQSSNTALMFPGRSAPNEVFQSGADLGALVYSNVGDGHFKPSFGVFNGDSLGLTLQDIEARGVVLSARADVNPFGAFPFDEGDTEGGGFRLGLGAGLMYRPATLYDGRTGYELTSMDELRIAASVRMAIAGFYVGAEYLRRQQTDEFTSRPHVADGAYAQLSYFFRVIEQLALEPIARVGFVAKDETFDPRLTGWVDGGINVYPAAAAERPDLVRLSLQYLGERRFTEQEEAHGASISARLLF